MGSTDLLAELAAAFPSPEGLSFSPGHSLRQDAHTIEFLSPLLLPVNTWFFFFPCCLCRRRRLQKEEINYTQEKTTIRHDADPHT